MQVTATEDKNRFGYYLSQAEREPGAKLTWNTVVRAGACGVASIGSTYSRPVKVCWDPKK